MTYDDLRASAFEDFCPECLEDGEFSPKDDCCSRCGEFYCPYHVNDHECQGRDE